MKAEELQNTAKEILTLAAARAGEIEQVYGKIKEYGELGELIFRLESLVNASKGQGNIILSAPELSGISGVLQKMAKQ